ncbi:MAG: hypothetical protein Q7K65_03410 [Candidatus Buchananbacteria bacterium]|nr:hypothetical protein [Candidatus Buchananbacteria bacterium]
MKRAFVLIVAVVIAVTFIVPSASAECNAGKNLGRALLCPLKAVARVAVAAIDTVKKPKSLAILAAPKIVRQEAVDVVESAVRLVVNEKPIANEEVGELNTAITEAGLDPVVDLVVYGVATGTVVHNGNDVGAIHHVGKAAVTAAGIAAISDLAVEAAE